MWISHHHKYVFIQLPRSGSTAIGRELRDYYDATKILYKHATYEDFLKIAGPEEKNYFVFSCIRNPLDDVLSIYTKYKKDHKNWYTNPEKVQRLKPWTRFVDKTSREFIVNENIDFETYFLKFYRIPYNNWSELSHHKFDFIIRFENLSQDFTKALRMMGIKPKRELPWINKSLGRDSKFSKYYTSPQLTDRAKRVFGPFMNKWGYDFPKEWGPYTLSRYHRAEFAFYNIFRRFYWKHLK